MNIQIFWQIVTVRNVPWAAVNLKGWHLGNPEKSIIGDQKSIISARLLDVCGVFYLANPQMGRSPTKSRLTLSKAIKRQSIVRMSEHMDYYLKTSQKTKTILLSAIIRSKKP